MSTAINIYQVFTRLFRNDSGTNKAFGTIEENGCSKFEHFDHKALQAIEEMGFTHIWFTGILRHATCTNYEKYGIPANNPFVVKGRAGSPYAITDYFDVDPDLATEPQNRMAEFESLIERCHKYKLKIIIDFVPNHVARQYQSINLPQGTSCLGVYDNSNEAFNPANNFYYFPGQAFEVPPGVNFPYCINAPGYHEFPAKATGNNAFTPHPGINDWYETIKLNYGTDFFNNLQNHFNPVPDTWHKMLDILRFWCQKKIDAFRCDMAEMVPREFWKWAIQIIKTEFPSIVFIAEVYNPNEYKNFLDDGFDFLYDKVGLYDISRSLVEGYGNTIELSQLWQRYEGYSHKMLRFLENHDEQRIASEQFAGNPWKAVPAIILAATFNTGPLMIYFGQEIGERAADSEGFSGYDGRTSIFDYWCVTEYQKWVNGGNFDSQKLSTGQQKLREFYIKINYLRLQNQAINRGGFYDLMWVNGHNYCQGKVFAYLRYAINEILLVVLNFDSYNTYSINLIVPHDAVELSNLPQNKRWIGTEITGHSVKFEVLPETAAKTGILLELPASTGYIFKIE